MAALTLRSCDRQAGPAQSPAAINKEVIAAACGATVG